MIDYSKIKVGFTKGGDFSLSANPYVGYYHVVNSIPFAGNVVADVSIPLDVDDTMSSNVIISEYFKDLIITDSAELPYTYERDLMIAPNEICGPSLFNDRLQKLYTNSIYLYSKLFLANNNIPVGYDMAAGTIKNTNTLGWVIQDASSGTSFNPFASAGYAELDNVTSIKSVKMDDGNFSFIGVTPTHFVALSSSSGLDQLTVVLITDKVDNNTDLTYTQLSSICVDSGFAFICDTSQNTIYKYDVSGFFNNDPTIANTKFLVGLIGGYGSSLSKTKFNAPNIIFANREIDRLYVNDRDNHCVKIYDFNMSYTATKTFTAGTRIDVRAFEYNAINKYVYFITHNQTTGANLLQLCDANLNSVQDYILQDNLDSDEYIRGITFSKNDSNIFYMTTNKNVFKKFISKPQATIGKWLFYNSGAVTTHIWNLEKSVYNKAQWNWNEGTTDARVSVSVLNLDTHFINDDSREEIFLFAGANKRSFNRIMHYKEPNQYIPAVGNTDINSYNILFASVDPNEFINGMVINKELYKVAYNAINIIRLITNRYNAEYDYLNNLVFKGVVPLTDSEFNLINNFSTTNLFIHENEIANSSGPLNRSIKTLVDLQSSAIQIVRIKTNSFVASLSGTRTIVLN